MRVAVGEHRSLVEPLLEEDADSAEKALLAFSQCLGSVHAATIGRAATFEAVVRRLHADAGIATLRQRVLARLEAFVATAKEFGRLPALRGMAAQLLEILQTAWPDTPSLPVYPAFNR